jgi:hypothetical protein
MADGGLDAGTVAALITAGTAIASGLGLAIRWSAGIVRDAMKDSTLAIRESTAAMVRLAEWLGRVDVRTEDVHSRVVEVHHEISGVHEAVVAAPEPAANGAGDPDVTPVDVPRRPSTRPGTYGAASRVEPKKKS